MTTMPPPPERHQVTITYLDQRERPRMAPPAKPAFRTAMMRATRPPLGFYRHVWNAVGEPHRWVSRRYMSDEALSRIVHDDRVAIYVLYKEGWPAGFAEVDWRKKPVADFKFFGLVPEAQGEGLGRWFLRQVLDLVWSAEPQRVIIETCSMDSPAALRLYQREGFSVYDQAKGVIEWRG
jgi:GNAT superfamily N-acetyltransferase